jgi:integrase/recombinase XerD
MGVLQEKMRRDLRTRGFSPSTENHYLRHMRSFVRYFGISPEKLNLDQIQQYHLHLIERGLSPQSVNLAMAAIRFFYLVTLSRSWKEDAIPWMKVKKQVPIVLSPQEVAKLINCVRDLKYRAIFTTIYSAGLRVGEAVRLGSQDIDSRRMLIHVRFGKGGKERYSILSPVLLEVLRRYWRESREDKSYWLFPSPEPTKPVDRTLLRQILLTSIKRSGIQKRVTIHTLRHCFATHLLENGVDIRYIQSLLGHATISSTTRYAQVRDVSKLGLKSPLDAIASKLIR